MILPLPKQAVKDAQEIYGVDQINAIVVDVFEVVAWMQQYVVAGEGSFVKWANDSAVFERVLLERLKMKLWAPCAVMMMIAFRLGAGISDVSTFSVLNRLILLMMALCVKSMMVNLVPASRVLVLRCLNL
eukprot:GABV01010223.1.p1 GENE.GABV01010223.1~~GABV01010223.1.p1  ORF type:complete len:130 (+),score=28.98 GABV01010223.1:1-390(+)